jgi:quinohemoprotein ethanol dehydrogenase
MNPHSPMSVLRSGILALLAGSLCSACETPPQVLDDAALANETENEDWLAFGRTYSEQRFSPVAEIDTTNVGSLRPDWYIDLPDDRSLVSTPLVRDGVLYFTGSLNRVRAVDATSGAIRWEYDPHVAEAAATRMRAGWDVSRGIALWGDNVYLATWDGRLIAITAAEGREVWSTQTIEPDKAMYITGAPKVFKGKVLVGNGGTENGPARGYVTAYDALTGEQAWRFYIVPGNPADGFENDAMRMAAETWTGEWWKFGGGGNAWHGFTYDPELDQLYIGTGNGSPWNRKIRSPGGGDNLFLSSIVALDPDDGRYLWHYQNSPGETWDFNANMDIVLADLTINGETVKAMMQAPKNGFFYVIDRRTGKLISAEPITEVTWATHVDLATGRPVEVPGARYESGRARVAPGPLGAHSWHAMSYNPNTGLAYIPAMHLHWAFDDTGFDLAHWTSQDWTGGTGVASYVVGVRADGIASSLIAWDPVTQKKAWEVPLTGLWNAGTLTTAGGLVFQGRADGNLHAYNARTGQELWKYNAGLGISAPPITYVVNGRQYVAVLVGWGAVMAGMGGASAAAHGWAYGAQTRRLIAFSLEGSATVPPQPPPVVPTPLASPEFGVNTTLANGASMLFNGICAGCHGPGAVAAGMAPDLRASGVVLSVNAFAEVVRGSRVAKGMPRYDGLTDEQLLALRHYIRQQAEATMPAMTVR